MQDFLAKSGIRTLVCGHVPHGDCPAVVNNDTVRVITADTSYSSFGHKSAWGEDNRGEAVGELVFECDSYVSAWGVLADGTKYEYSLKAIGESGGDAFVGRQLEDKSWVKARIAGADEYLVCLGEGRKLTHRRVSAAELKAATFLDQVEKSHVCKKRQADMHTNASTRGGWKRHRYTYSGCILSPRYLLCHDLFGVTERHCLFPSRCANFSCGVLSAIRCSVS